jgi:hypothetical protein
MTATANAALAFPHNSRVIRSSGSSACVGTVQAPTERWNVVRVIWDNGDVYNHHPRALALAGKLWTAPVVIELEPIEHIEAEARAEHAENLERGEAVLNGIRPSTSACRHKLVQLTESALREVIDAGMGPRTYRTARLFKAPNLRMVNRFLDSRYGADFAVLHHDDRGVFVADVADRGVIAR